MRAPVRSARGRCAPTSCAAKRRAPFRLAPVKSALSAQAWSRIAPSRSAPTRRVLLSRALRRMARLKSMPERSRPLSLRPERSGGLPGGAAAIRARTAVRSISAVVIAGEARSTWSSMLWAMAGGTRLSRAARTSANRRNGCTPAPRRQLRREGPRRSSQVSCRRACRSTGRLFRYFVDGRPQFPQELGCTIGHFMTRHPAQHISSSVPFLFRWKRPYAQSQLIDEIGAVDGARVDLAAEFIELAGKFSRICVFGRKQIDKLRGLFFEHSFPEIRDFDVRDIATMPCTLPGHGRLVAWRFLRWLVL